MPNTENILGDLSSALARQDRPLPELTRDERLQAERMLRMVKAGLLGGVSVKLQRRDGVLVLDPELPDLPTYQCKP